MRVCLPIVFAFVLACCGGPASREVAPSGSAAVDLLVHGDDPLDVHVRIGADTAVTVRTLASEERAWTDLGAWRFGPSDDDADAALTGLRSALRGPLTDPRTREPDGSSKARMLLDVEGDVPWRLVQWTIQIAAHPLLKIWRLSLIDPEGDLDPVPVELPRDRSVGSAPPQGKPVSVRVLVVTCFRKRPEAPRSLFTRLRFRAIDEQVVAPMGGDPPPLVITSTTTEVLKEALPTEGEEQRRNGDLVVEEPVIRESDDSVPDDGASAAPADQADVDLEPADGVHWREVEQRLRTAAAGARILRAEVRTPPPDGGAVPYRDVFHVLRLLREVGVGPVAFEGAMAPPPPQPSDGPSGR